MRDADVAHGTQEAGFDAHFRSYIDHAPVGIAFADEHGLLTYANERWRHLAGFDGELPASRDTMLGLVHPDDQPIVLATFQRSTADQSEVRQRVRVIAADSTARHLTLSVRPVVDGSGIATGYSVGLSDVTELTAALEEVRRSETRFRSITSALPFGVFRADPDGNVFWANARMEEIAGCTTEEIRGASVFLFTHPDDRDEVYVRARDALLRNEDFESHHRFLTRSGDVRWVISRSSSLHDDSGRILEHVGSIEDITALHLRSEGLAHQANHDPLTGLPNRASIEDLVTSLVAERPGRTDIGVVFLDLDGFKAVNDTHGHQAGDAVLIEVAARLRSVTRQGDTVGRYGGDEFVVVCPGIGNPTLLTAVAERARLVIRDSLVDDGTHAHCIGASVGTAVGPGAGSVDDLLHAADASMYSAKRSNQA